MLTKGQAGEDIPVIFPAFLGRIVLPCCSSSLGAHGKSGSTCSRAKSPNRYRCMIAFTSSLDKVRAKGRPSTGLVETFATSQKLGTKKDLRFSGRRNLRNPSFSQHRSLSGAEFHPRIPLKRLQIERATPDPRFRRFRRGIPGRVLRGGNKTGLRDLRSAVSAGSETRAEQFCYRLAGPGGDLRREHGHGARRSVPGGTEWLADCHARSLSGRDAFRAGAATAIAVRYGCGIPVRLPANRCGLRSPRHGREVLRSRNQRQTHQDASVLGDAVRRLAERIYRVRRGSPKSAETADRRSSAIRETFGRRGGSVRDRPQRYGQIIPCELPYGHASSSFRRVETSG
jgi:hypothetical protein